MEKKNTIIIYLSVIIGLSGYFLFSLSFLCNFPYVHSDEAWLSGLSRQIAESSDLASTEAFFNLKDRFPHAIKIIFQLLQIAAMRIGGYSIGTFRIISLVTALLVLLLFFVAARRLFMQKWAAIAAMALLAADVQFIYASHMARQEIFILLAVTACLIPLLNRHKLNNKQIATLALLSGLSVGIHPNAFIVACMCGVVLLLRCLFKLVSVKQIGLYILLTGAIAAIFVGISFCLDRQFIPHYLSYAQNEFGLNASLSQRLGEAVAFHSKLFSGISGTYYLPKLWLQLLIFPIFALLLACYTLVMRKEQPQQTAQAATLLGSALGILCGIVLIGRYNQLSIVFLFPVCWLITLYALSLFGKRLFCVCTALLLAIVIGCSYTSIKPWLATDYDQYLENFTTTIPRGAITLGNLNSEYAFANGQLLDYRNLAFLQKNNMDISDYVRQSNIEYIVWSDELTYIDENRPYWNIIYGNIDISALKQYLEENCVLVRSFTNHIYGVRIVNLIGNNDYGNIGIYQVIKSKSTD